MSVSLNSTKTVGDQNAKAIQHILKLPGNCLSHAFSFLTLSDMFACIGNRTCATRFAHLPDRVLPACPIPAQLLIPSAFASRLRALNSVRHPLTYKNNETHAKLTHNQPLKNFAHIDLHDSGIDDEGLLKLVELHPDLVSLNLSRCNNITNEGLKHLQKLPKLQKLILQGNTLTKEGFQYLTGFSLYHLDLSSSSIDAEDLAQIIQCQPNLAALNLSRCRDLGEKGIALLQQLPKLDQLSLANICDNNSLQHLANIRTLKRLDLCQNDLTDLSPLQYLTNLQYLNLSECHFLENVESLQNLIHLEELILQDCFALMDINPLQGLTELIRLDLGNCSIQNLPLANLQKLQVLNLIGIENLTNIEPLQHLKRLQYLYRS